MPIIITIYGHSVYSETIYKKAIINYFMVKVVLELTFTL